MAHYRTNLWFSPPLLPVLAPYGVDFRPIGRQLASRLLGGLASGACRCSELAGKPRKPGIYGMSREVHASLEYQHSAML